MRMVDVAYRRKLTWDNHARNLLFFVMTDLGAWSMRFCLTFCMFLLSSAALSQTLTTELARGFVNSLPEVNSYSETLDDEISEMSFQDAMMPRAGEPFAPYSRAMEFVRNNHVGVHQDMTELVTGFGFASAEEWATTGDRVVSAYMATQISPADMQQMEQFTPEMLDQMPAQMRPQIEVMLAMVETIRNIPEADIEVVRPLVPQMEQFMNMQVP